MKSTSVIVAIIGFGAGMIAAWYWYKSTRVYIDPSIGSADDGEKRFFMMRWIESVTKTSETVSQLNAKAAVWTALSVLLGGASTVLNAWSSN